MNKATTEALERWLNAQKEVESLKRSLSSAECNLSNIQNALGKVLVPKNAGNGESFHIWVDGAPMGKEEDQLLTVTYDSSRGSYTIQMRKGGRNG